MKILSYFVTFAALAIVMFAAPVFLPPMLSATASYPAVSVLAFLIVMAVLTDLSIAAFLRRSSVLARVLVTAFQHERQEKAIAA